MNKKFKGNVPELLRRLGRIEMTQFYIIERLEHMAINFTRLEEEVSQNSDVVASVVTLLSSLADAIRDAAANQQKVEALAARLDTQTQALADAVAASTPVATS